MAIAMTKHDVMNVLDCVISTMQASCETYGVEKEGVIYMDAELIDLLRDVREWVKEGGDIDASLS